MARGRLFNNCWVSVNPEVQDLFLSWKSERARDMYLLKFFHSQMMRLGAPVVLDIGACVGNFAMVAKFCPGATIYAFEPNPENYRYLTEHIRSNNLQTRVKAFRIALSDKFGDAVLEVPGGRGGGMGGSIAPRQDTVKKFKVKTCKLDRFSYLWNSVDLIKIDVEGAELLVLRGGEETIKKHKPGILIEYERRNTRRFDYPPNNLKALLESWGYKKYHMLGKRGKDLDMWAEV